MVDTNHIQVSAKVYCELLKSYLPLTGSHYTNNCLGRCPYFAGSAQGEGVECLWNDGTNAGVDRIGTNEQALELSEERKKTRPKGLDDFIALIKGGPGSGHHGHAGVPGKVGGSAATPTPVLTIEGKDAVKTLLDGGDYPLVYTAHTKKQVVRRVEKLGGAPFTHVRVGGMYHVIDPSAGPVKTVTVAGKAGFGDGTYVTVYSVPTNKKAAERKAEKLGPGYAAVRTERAYHVVKTGGPTAGAGLPTPKVAKPKPVKPKPPPAKPEPKPTERPTTRERPARGKEVVIPVNEETEKVVNRKVRRFYGAENLPKAHEELKHMMEGSRVAINMPPDVASKVIAGGGFKNQHETGTSRGTLSPRMRRDAERNAFGEHLRSPKDFPIYGFVDTHVKGYTPRAHGYGSIRAILKDDVEKRTTVTVGDSLGKFRDKAQIGTPMRDPRIGSLDRVTYEPRNSRGQKLVPFGYYEAQIHGGVSTKDIAVLLIPGKSAHRDPYATSEYDKIAKQAKEAGIWVKRVDELY